MIKPFQIEAEPPKPLPEGPIDVTIENAILLALENNRSLRVERINPSIQQTFEEEERAVFDPGISGGLFGSRERSETRSATTGEFSDTTSNETAVDLGISQFFSTGTEVGVDLSTERAWSDREREVHATRAGLTVTQALLRGIGPEANLANLRQAQLDTLASQYELRGFAESLVALVEETSWDYILAERQIEIVTVSLELAEQQLRETEERIKIGTVAEIERAAAQAEIALRRVNLINARNALATTRLRLLRLLNPPGPKLWDREIILRDRPVVPEVIMDEVESHVDVALRMRPDLNQARLEVQRGDLEIIKTKNGLLPVLDLFITLGKTGYADSFGDSVTDIDGKGYDISGGIGLAYPLRNREAKASHRRAILDRTQAVEAVDNLAQLVQVDVRAAYIEVQRAKEQVAATTASRKLEEEKLRAETEKFRVGRSTTLLVAGAQRDLVISQIAEVRAVADYLKALVNLYRLEGSLLERRGISAPGREPVDLSIPRKW
ncbi:MAG: TolC family protein [Proteobacteria bacterium]|nr:TolC family protein [Pseudomonadota bacterium]